MVAKLQNSFVFPTHQILKVIKKESVPAIYQPLRNSIPIKDLKRHHVSFRAIYFMKFNANIIFKKRLFKFQAQHLTELISGKYLLQDRNDRWLPLLQKVKHHQDVSIRREAPSGSVTDVTAL